MKTRKSKVFTAIAAAMLAGILTLSACSSGSTESKGESSKAESSAVQGSAVDAKDDNADSKTAEVKVHDFSGDGSNVVDIGTPANSIDVEKIQRNMGYIPEMLCTEYQVIGSETKVLDTVMATGLYKYNEKASSGGGIERQITNMPYYLKGNQFEYTGESGAPSKLYVMDMKFFDETGSSQSKRFKYSINTIPNVSSKLKLEEIINIKYDDTYEKIASYETAQLKLEYTISIKGFTLTLSKDGVASIEMKTGYNDPAEEMSKLSSFAFISENSPMIDHIAGFAVSENSYCNITFINDEKEDETSYYAHAQMTDDGVFTFSVPYATKTETYQYVFIYLGYDGLILTDGNTVYKYTSREDDYKTYKMKSILGDDASTDDVSSDKQKELVVKQNTILTELEEAFAANDIKATIDKSTGRVSLDSNILFASDSSDLSADGKKTLDSFIKVYTSVLLSDTNKNYVAKLLIEGHTDTNGDHEYNQKLSEKRAKTVADYCVSKEASLKSIIESKGYSYDNPIYNEDGTVNMAASRRVVFRFMLQQK